MKVRVGAELLAVMRGNLAVRLYELELERERTEADSALNDGGDLAEGE